MEVAIFVGNRTDFVTPAFCQQSFSRDSKAVKQQLCPCQKLGSLQLCHV